MKTIKEIKDIISFNLKTLTDKYHVKNIGIFGSYVHGVANENSDVDIIVEFSKPVGLIEFIQLEEYLHELLDVKVDLVLKEGIKPALRNFIIPEVVYV